MSKEAAKFDPRVSEEQQFEATLLAETEEDRAVRRDRTFAHLRILWEHRNILFKITCAGLMVAAVMAVLIPNEYASSTRLMPPDEMPGPGLGMVAAMAGKATNSLGALGGELLGFKTTGDLFIGILQSRTVGDDLISRFDLRRVYGDKRWEDARNELSSQTNISADRKSGIITIEVSDRNPWRAQQMAQEYVTELDRVVNTLNASSAHRERDFLEGRLNQVQTDLESAEKQFSAFASKNTAIDIQEQGKAMIEAGATLEGEWIAAQTELQGLKQVYTDNNVRVRETRARVDELRRQLQKLGGQAGETSSQAKQEGSSVYPSIRKLPLLGVAYADLYRRMRVEEAVFETLTQEYEMAKVEEAKETPSVKVLDSPDLPERKSSPHRLVIAFTGTVFAGVFGVAWVFGSAQWQQIGANHPAKILAREIFRSVRENMPWVSRNGARRHTDELDSRSGKERVYPEGDERQPRHPPRGGL